MKEVLEATVIMAKCAKTKKPYGIRMEKRSDNVWYYTWAFPLSEKAAAHEGYGETIVAGNVDADSEYPGCPHCGSMGWFNCVACHKLTCWEGEKRVTCAWCGQSGECSSGDSFDLRGGGY